MCVRKMMMSAMSMSLLASFTLVGCGPVTIPLPDLTDELKESQQKVVDGVEEEFHRRIDPSLPADQQVKQLASDAKVEYCRFEGSPVAEAIKNVAVTMRDEIASSNPDVEIPQLDLRPEVCE